PRRERREGRAAGDDQPDLVTVPDRPDRLEHRRALLLVARHEREQDADAEVEAFEQEVGAPEDGDQDEPEGLEVHQYATPAGASGASGASCSPSSRPA